MDISKRYLIPYKGLSIGDHTFEFEVDDRFFEAFEGSEIRRGHLKVTVGLNRQSSVLTLGITIRGAVTVACDRCLDDFEMPVDYTGTLVVRFSETEADYDGEIMWVNPAEGEFSLAQYIYESIWLSLPYQKVHPLDAGGRPTCNPDMLSRFRIVSAQEFDSIAAKAEQSVGQAAEWDKLAQLKAQMEDAEKKQQ
ncbi:MAG: DUF177 domain-containing protein [Rikenellaceae bacterium]|nr:DUF177 domain-containing protein [Rikenellaceae bacterium]